MDYPTDIDVESSYIVIPTFKRVRVRLPEDSLVISIAEWDSLLARVKSCKVSLQLRALAASVAFAIGVTAGLSIIPILFSQLPIWVLIAYAVTCAFGIGIGIGLVIAARSDSHSQQSHIDDLIADMEKRRAPFSNPPPEHPEPEAIQP